MTVDPTDNDNASYRQLQYMMLTMTIDRTDNRVY